ncbi:Na+/H+ antiporter subunit E [Spiractinospora alimapuensis]|nr:Na+/H+ antiporter subunit E [Spiractinospora alimapuensis]
MVVFACQFAFALVTASFQVARDVLAPNSRFRPGIVEFPLRCSTDFEITMMANCITLTPGTLTLAVRTSPPTLWVHGMYCKDRDQAIQELRDYESQMLRGIRRDGVVPDAPVTENGPIEETS